MKLKLASLAVLVLMPWISTHVYSQASWAVSPAWSHASDSDGLTINKWFASALPSYQSGLVWQGIEWQQQRYTLNDTRLTGQGLNYTAQNIDAISGMGHSYKLGVNQGPEKSLITGDLSWNRALTSQVQWGVFANRDWVESMLALQRGIHYDLIGANVDYQIHPRLTLIGSLAQTHFSDGQNRQQQRARMVWDAWPQQGVTLQWSQKHQLGEPDAGQRLYFNPERLDESMGIIGWRRRFEGWQWYARLGSGRQQMIHQGSTPARLAELQLSSPIHGHSYVKLKVGRTQSFGYQSSDYVYRYFDVQWIMQLDR